MSVPTCTDEQIDKTRKVFCRQRGDCGDGHGSQNLNSIEISVVAVVVELHSFAVWLIILYKVVYTGFAF